MFNLYCTDISATNHVFGGKQMIKSSTELGLNLTIKRGTLPSHSPEY